jgi:hypothetical protein
LLTLLISAIIAGAFFATHPDVFSASAAHTSTPTTAATATAVATGTPASGPTVSVQTGSVSYPQDKVHQVQHAANRGDPKFTYYLDPHQVVMRDLPLYGFKGRFSILSPPPPQPTATPYTNAAGQPEVQLTVKYRGQKYLIILDQLVQKGPKGIWLITSVNKLQAA